MGTAQSLSQLCPCRGARLSWASSAAATRTLSDRPSIFYTRNRSEAGGSPDARAHTHTVQRNGLLKSLREQSWEASGRVSRGATGIGTSVHGLQRLALGARRLSIRHPRSHCTPSSSTYVEGNQPTCRGSREVSWRLGSSRDLLCHHRGYSPATTRCSR